MGSHRSAIRMLFAATTFVAAALVFVVQPMVARQLLPAFGGTPGVWNATVTFFQVALLAGYAIAHVSLRRLGVRRQPAVQVALLLAGAAFLPFSLASASSPPDAVPPAVWIAALLAASVGLPYLAVTTASPVLQRWYAELGQDDSHEPWFLYVASNAGSLVGLLAYPVVLEPHLATAGQARAWAIGFAVYAAALGACALVVRRRATPARGAGSASPGAGDRSAATESVGWWRGVRWTAIAALPVALMLGATTFITTDVASAPFIWVVPLALYLVSFMVTFGRRWRIGPRVAGLLAGAATLFVLLIELERLDVDEFARVGAHLAAAFLAAVLAHAVLYADRPRAGSLTTFYLLLSLGGALGGTFVSMLAPLAFDDVYEYPLLLAAVALLRPALRPAPEHAVARALVLVTELAVAGVLAFALAGAATQDAGFDARFASDGWVVATVGLGALLLVRRAGFVVLVTITFALFAFASDERLLLQERNFFGTTRVDRQGDMRRMLHGTTLHGGQLVGVDDARLATTYYTQAGPVGDVFREFQREAPFVEVGVVGLGTGSTLTYARLWQRFTFYEIDPAVIDAAQDEDLFTLVSDAQVDVRIVEGDARLELEDERRRFDLLVLDAYSSDAVPTHLLTTEAFELYLDRVTDRGVLALHISSRHLELEPVVAANVERLGIAARTRVHRPSDTDRTSVQATSSQWIVIAQDEALLAPIDGVTGWRELEPADASDAWTDDYSNVASTVRWLPDWLR